MTIKTGNISVHTQNIFPIIKKFLYSDTEIFVRELVSNAVDATRKLQALASIGEFKGELGDLKVRVSVDEQAGTITFSDNGIGMTAEEIEKYINQIAFSGAEEFLEQYKNKAESQIIGHFGLGFYSAFMVAHKVTIHTKSWKEEPAAIWECDGSTSFSISEGSREDRGTTITLYVAEDSKEFLDKFRLKSILEKHCRFLPIEIEYDGQIINDTKPLWTRKPSELKEEDYREFYSQLFPMAEPPLFWIHLNVDYPFNLTGILYFPKVKKEVDPNQHKIQLYSNQVFVTDHVKDVVPEFLMLLHGVIDSPDLPLNVSRSALQSDSNVKKITGHITKKVADKLQELFKEDRKAFEEKWDSIGLFVKYGAITDEKFADRAKGFSLLKNLDQQYFTTEEYREKVQALQTDKDNKVVFLYADQPGTQQFYTDNLKKRGYDILQMDAMLDNHYIGFLEMKQENLKLTRVDADVPEKIIDKGTKNESILSKADEEKLVNLLQPCFDGAAKYEIKPEPLNIDDDFLTIVQPEWERRMKDMAAMGGMAFFAADQEKFQVVLNTNHPLSRKVVQMEAAAEQETLLSEAVDLALLGQQMLKGERLTRFIHRNFSKLAAE